MYGEVCRDIAWHGGAVVFETRGPEYDHCALGSVMFWQVSHNPRTWMRAFGSPPPDDQAWNACILWQAYA